VQPLGLPDAASVTAAAPAQLERAPAVQLFIERAGAARPGFELDGDNAAAVAEICIRLDGLPLALELAAARIRMLPPQAILTRLDDKLALLVGGPRDLDQRQQTLRAAISWSYDLLDERERAAFRRLALPAGSFTLEAAEALLAAPGDIDAVETFGYLESLLDKSLIRQAEGVESEARFAMLGTLRAFGLEQADAEGEMELLREAQARQVSGYIRRRVPELTGEGQRDAFQALDLENDNLRGALEWAIDRRQTSLAIALASPLWRYWTTRGLLSEGYGWLMSLLDLPDLEEVAAGTRAELFDGIGAIAYLMGDRRMAERYYRLALATLDDDADPQETVRILNHLALAVQDQGNRQEAASLLERALEESRSTGDARLIGLSLYNLSYLAAERGDFPGAVKLARESMPYFEEIGDELSVADHLNTLGYLAYAQGDLEQARELCERSQSAFETLDDLYGVGEASGDLGMVLEALGEREAARGAYARAIELGEETGNNRRVVEAQLGLGRIEGLDSRPERALALYEEALRTNRELDYRIGLVASLLHLASALLDAGDAKGAQTHLRESLELSRALDHHAGVALGLAGFAAAGALAGPAGEARGYLRSADQLLHDEAITLMPHERRWYDQFKALAEQGMRQAGTAEPERAVTAAPPAAAPAAPEPERAPERFGITTRELDVIRLLVDGLSNQEIADQLFITRRTTTTHVANIMNKLGLSSRTAVAALAVREGFA
jgi:DNA-binding CsgD family transcriptional regulator